MLLRKHETGRSADRSDLGFGQKAHKAGEVLSFLAGNARWSPKTRALSEPIKSSVQLDSAHNEHQKQACTSCRNSLILSASCLIPSFLASIDDTRLFCPVVQQKILDCI